jgi:hypothetical protein
MSRSEYQRQWYIDNKDKVKIHQQRHRDSIPYDPSRFTKNLIKQSKGGAKKRGIPYCLTYNQVYNKLVESNGKCALSGKDLTTVFNSPMIASIDRIDSSKGYTKNNIQIVGAVVNKAKNTMSVAEFVDMCRSVSSRIG